MALTWIFVPGGTCEYGDEGRPVSVRHLRWTATAITTDDDRPLTGVSHGEATDIAARLGGRLPTSAEWEWMAAGPERRPYPWGDQPWQPDLANLRGSLVGNPEPVGAHPKGATPLGLLDVAGNVWEWTSTTTLGKGAIIRGGSFASLPLYARCTFLNAAPVELASPGIGFRVVREL
ncbi:SUMF1/EgtB/PvdO family nonheme iron enzyme [Spongiactinospora sp. TRM90649]|uniref:formylglycine-generating enzyme family protein n=1 Tax=Spongiactinospora sp. TRM90649 TaxID=3031114 RepID=UPI0023F7A8D6|nr:SUMF1/EgtB/PvdO family nonheme iron enzyme [Spongiactinospora sp. TRM90649]MDF5759033.1 SUMF1/EgtB/PvdO family nonheme iron enzyme [Spongiactinospora sp. TRM90649]